MPGYKPSGPDNKIYDITSDDISKKDNIETTEEDISAEMIYKNAPKDFSAKLHWNTGSLPTPYNKAP